MEVNIPQEAVKYGFVISGSTAHTSRTIMLKELRLLLGKSSSHADLESFRQAILESNVLLKPTVATRKESFSRLRQLYSLDNNLLLFRALRDLWELQSEAQPMLALLCAVARDPLLRATADVILSVSPGSQVTPHEMSKCVDTSFPARYTAVTLATVGRNTISSWQQSGHLQGHLRKTRAIATSYPTSTAFALLLGYLCGSSGMALFQTPWGRLLDLDTGKIQEQAEVAARQGWLDYRRIGDITEIGFKYLLRDHKHE